MSTHSCNQYCDGYLHELQRDLELDVTNEDHKKKLISILEDALRDLTWKR